MVPVTNIRYGFAEHPNGKTDVWLAALGLARFPNPLDAGSRRT